MNCSAGARIIVLPVQSKAPPSLDPAAWLMSGASRIVRPKEALVLLGIGKTTLYRMIAEDPKFPKPRHLRPRVTGWLESELIAYIVSLRAPKVQP